MDLKKTIEFVVDEGKIFSCILPLVNDGKT